MKVKRALISVYDKTGVESFAKFLTNSGIEILSSGGTAKHLQQHEIPVTEITEVTGFPEILDGRVKTIHPKISAGILAKRDEPNHIQQLQQHNIKEIDMVVANLYPFLQALEAQNKSQAEMIELIDIGGPTLIRAAAKNYSFVAVITNPGQMESMQKELEQNNGEISQQTRLKLAQAAFQHTAYYDAMINLYFQQQWESDEQLPAQYIIPLHRTAALRYGENPHQKACFYQTSTTGKIEGIEQLQGIELSYNNLLDLDAAVQTAMDFEEPTVVITKHTNPCGIGSDSDLTAAYQKALATDPISAYGGILSINRPLTKALAEQIKSHFLEVLVAPDFDTVALEVLHKKKKLRILKTIPKKGNKGQRSWYMRSVLDGYLVQQKDTILWDDDKLKVVTQRQPTTEEWQALKFNWRVVKHVKSNAIVFGSTDRTLGIGAGQMSRVDSVELAVKKSQQVGLSLQGSVLASDAFFPFRDGVDAAARVGVSAIVQPGGSIRDEEVITAANEHNIAMIFTGMRHFRH